MKPKEIFATSFASVLILMTMCLCQSLGYSQSPSDGIIKGTVRVGQDRGLDVRMPRAVITFTNKDVVRKATASDIGEYSVTVPPGIYSVAVDGYKIHDTTYRSDIKIEANSTRNLNFKLYTKVPLFWAWAGAYVKDADHPSAEYATFSYEPIPNLGDGMVRNGMIRFAEKCQTPLLISYSGRSIGDRDSGITFTSDFLTIIADDLHINTKTKEIFALGNLEIENDTEYLKYKGVIQIIIKDGKASYKKIDQ